MEFSVCIQCFNKPLEIMSVLDSLEKNAHLDKVHLVLYVDKARTNIHFQKNSEVKRVLTEYKLTKNAL